MAPFRIGFIGGGLNSAVGRCHQIACRMDGRWELAAGAFSRQQDVNGKTGSSWGIPPQRTYRDWTEFVERELHQLDAVAVLTPTPQHYEQIKALLTAGHNVISEKALATTSEQADELHDLARQNNLFLKVTMNYSGYPMVRELRNLIHVGALGDIVGLNVRMPQEGFLRQDRQGKPLMPQEWRQQDGRVPMVSLDLGTHTHHLISFLLGKNPVRVVGTQSHHGRVSNVADYVSSLAKMPSGADVNMWFGKCILGARNGLAVDVWGQRASASWRQDQPEIISLASADGSVALIDRASPQVTEASQNRYQRFKAGHPAGFLEAFANVYYDLADDLAAHFEGSPATGWTFGADHAAAGLAMLEGISKSHTSSSWEEIHRDR